MLVNPSRLIYVFLRCFRSLSMDLLASAYAETSNCNALMHIDSTTTVRRYTILKAAANEHYFLWNRNNLVQLLLVGRVGS